MRLASGAVAGQNGSRHFPMAGGSERKGTGEGKAVMSISGHWVEPGGRGRKALASLRAWWPGDSPSWASRLADGREPGAPRLRKTKSKRLASVAHCLRDARAAEFRPSSFGDGPRPRRRFAVRRQSSRRMTFLQAGVLTAESNARTAPRRPREGSAVLLFPALILE